MFDFPLEVKGQFFCQFFGVGSKFSPSSSVIQFFFWFKTCVVSSVNPYSALEI